MSQSNQLALSFFLTALILGVVGLSADAVPALIAALPTMPQNDQCAMAARILDRWSPPKRFDVLTWNLDRSLAWQAVNAHWGYLQSVACATGRD